MVFKDAKGEYAADVVAMFEDAKRFFRENGIDQWQTGYPNFDTYYKDVRNGVCRVGFSGDCICAAVSTIYGVEPTYGEIDGAWLHEGPYVAVHRVVVKQSEKGRGIGSAILHEAERTAREYGARSARVDTHEMNKPMRRLLEKNGYTYCGVIHLADGAPRCAYEKLL